MTACRTNRLLDDDERALCQDREAAPSLFRKTKLARWHVCIFLGLTLVNLVPIWATEHFPSQNGPWFLLTTHMFMEYDDPQWNYDDFYVRNWHPIPHLLHDVLVGMASRCLPLLLAEKLVLSAYAIMLPASVFYFLSVVSPINRSLGYLSFLLVHNYGFYRGYHDFTLSIPLFFFALAIWYRGRHALTPGRAAALAVMSLLVYLSHLFAFMLLAGAIGWLYLFETRSFPKAFQAAIVVTWPGLLLFVDYLVLNSQATWLDGSDTHWLPFVFRTKCFARSLFYSISAPACLFAVSPWLVLGSLAAVRASPYLAAPLRSCGWAVRRPLFSLCMFLVLAYFVVPYHFIGWHKVNVRLLPFVYILGLACLAELPGLLKGRWTRVGLLVVVCIATVGTSVFVTREVLAMDRLVVDYVSGMPKCGPNSKMLPIHLESPKFGQVYPIRRAYEYYHISKGGANGEGVACYNTLSMMQYRDEPVEETFPAYDPSIPVKSLRSVIEAYDVVLVWGDDSRLDAELNAFGLQLVHEQNKMHVWEKR